MKNTNLSKTESLYWSIMQAKSGCLFVQGQAGVAKSAMAKSIADKLGYQYIDLRLSDKDEVDFGFPTTTKRTINGVEKDVLTMALPEWFEMAQTQPTIICFEELNRAPEAVLNAALGVLNERILHNNKFNDNVYMIATGNLGEEDGCTVHEFEAALRNRLIFVKHTLTIDEWCENYADENVHESIVRYIKRNPSKFICDGKNLPEQGQYNTPRSWTFLSDFIKTNSHFLDDFSMLSAVAPSYVGVEAAVSFVSWLRDNMKLNVADVLKKKHDASEMDRAAMQAILDEFKEVYPKGLIDLGKKKIENFSHFLAQLPPELIASVLPHLQKIDAQSEEQYKTLLDFIKSDERIHKVMLQTFDSEDKAKGEAA